MIAQRNPTTLRRFFRDDRYKVVVNRGQVASFLTLAGAREFVAKWGGKIFENGNPLQR